MAEVSINKKLDAIRYDNDVCDDLLFSADSFLEHDCNQINRINLRTNDAFYRARNFLYRTHDISGYEFDLFLRSYRAYHTLGALGSEIKYCYEFEYFEKGTANSLGTFVILL